MEPLPELYSIFQGEVAAVTDFGAFVAIPGCRKQGLVHRTHMSSCRVDKPSEIVDVGDKVWVKLIGKEMKEDKLKLSLSMKVVHQGTGKDLDPNNVCLDQDERKKRTFRDYTSQKITLEAVLNTVCKKCGCKGHFAKECFMQPGGTKYSLIPEEEEEEVAAAGREGDKKISKAEESSKKRKKVQGACVTSCPACSPHVLRKFPKLWNETLLLVKVLSDFLTMCTGCKSLRKFSLLHPLLGKI
ncbi:nucleolar protein of 40 kDa isoform X3 [Corvus moneduloides]|uniref:nucleolar protein of 40 kDa isoform X3 n=1 Tax=Corvus moneduloides TaxID=1196302 RepID=UPI001361F772|nr:nucleolar protein of 40 kDa isoform X3 [Corvus moneduloides]